MDELRKFWGRYDVLKHELGITDGKVVHAVRALKSALAEREAELAKADAVIAWFDDYCGPSFKELAGEILIAKFEVAIARHAARQQQKYRK